MDKRKQIIELIKEDSWHNIPVENTVDKIFSILGIVGRSEQFYCTCSRAKGLDHDEEGTPYCISCQKEVQ